MVSDICWLPDLVIANNLADWEPYQEMLYGIFRSDFIDSRPVYKGKPVQIRKHPLDDGKEEVTHEITERSTVERRIKEISQLAKKYT